MKMSGAAQDVRDFKENRRREKKWKNLTSFSIGILLHPWDDDFYLMLGWYNNNIIANCLAATVAEQRV